LTGCIMKLVNLGVRPVNPRPTEASGRYFVTFVSAGDGELADFLQRYFGYCLTGSVAEEKLAFVHGRGGTGKSTFMEALKAVFGEYAVTADFETFLARKATGGPRPDIARLAGARLVTSIEVDDGKRLAEGLVKQLTGGDTVTARELYAKEFEFVPQFKLVLVANHAPTVHSDDEAMWRRILRVPFDNAIPEAGQDRSVKLILRDPAVSGPAILAWLVEGCLQWQREGLRVPTVVTDATTDETDAATGVPLGGLCPVCGRGPALEGRRCFKCEEGPS